VAGRKETHFLGRDLAFDRSAQPDDDPSGWCWVMFYVLNGDKMMVRYVNEKETVVCCESRSSKVARIYICV
jgi:hypothetical protein